MNDCARSPHKHAVVRTGRGARTDRPPPAAAMLLTERRMALCQSIVLTKTGHPKRVSGAENLSERAQHIDIPHKSMHMWHL